jgi:hypothetical protein
MVQSCFPYVLKVLPETTPLEQHPENLIILGTDRDNRWIKMLAGQGLVDLPDQAEGYAICSLASPWQAGRKLLVIAGHDAKGVLNGVADLVFKVLPVKTSQADPQKMREAFDALSPFTVKDYPRIHNRGIWTWGYVMYDFRRFLDNMARLKLNILTIWNDCPPLNIDEVIAYAHERGVKVVLGFHWGWGVKNIDLADPGHCRRLREHVLENYRKNYRHLPHDGIYFQTITETQETMVRDVPRARLVNQLVNDIGRALLEENPGLYIQFGLHATSILDDYVCFKNLDERITIVWEDAGVPPYSYVPEPEYAADRGNHAEGLGSLAATIAYSKKLAQLRKGAEFALVPKGFSYINWFTEFEHHGPFILGERAPAFMEERLRGRQVDWDHMNRLWLKNYPLAQQFYREILAGTSGKMTATMLVEDGLFELAIQPCVALGAEIPWNPDQASDGLLRTAMNSSLAKRA